MADPVRMRSLTTFENPRIRIFREGGPPEGITGLPVVSGEPFETDLWHAKELDRLGHAEPVDPGSLEAETPPFEPHHQVSVDQIRAQGAEAATGSDARVRKPRAIAAASSGPAGRSGA